MLIDINGSSWPDGKLMAEVFGKECTWYSSNPSSYRATWEGCKEAAREARRRGIDDLVIRTRNRLVLDQARSGRANKTAHLRHLREWERLTSGMTVKFVSA